MNQGSTNFEDPAVGQVWRASNGTPVTLIADKGHGFFRCRGEVFAYNPDSEGSLHAVSYIRGGLWTRDLRTEREQRRREIDAVLREDARRFPAFATARKCAVMARAEALYGYGPDKARANLDALRVYEERRGGGRTPSAEVAVLLDEADPSVRDFYAAYERARAL